MKILKKVSSLFALFLSINLMACKEAANLSHEKVLGSSHPAKHGKPALAVNLENPQPIVLSSIGSATIDLNLMTAAASGTMEVSITAREGIVILSQPRQIFSLTPQGAYRVPLQISALEQGRFYIDLAIKVTEGGSSMERVITAIVQVGQPGNARLKKSDNASGDGGVIEMPARETFRSSTTNQPAY